MIILGPAARLTQPELAVKLDGGDVILPTFQPDLASGAILKELGL